MSLNGLSKNRVFLVMLNKMEVQTVIHLTDTSVMRDRSNYFR